MQHSITEAEIKSGQLIPWKRMGSYLQERPRAAAWVEAIIYVSLCFTLYHLGREVLGYKNNFAPCQIPQTENIRGEESPERFIRIGRETFYSRIDGKEISDMVK